MNYAEGITDDAQNISEPKNEAKSLKAAIRSSGRCRPFIDSVNHDDGGQVRETAMNYAEGITDDAQNISDIENATNKQTKKKKKQAKKQHLNFSFE
jgi:hypothetical protein